MGVIKESGTPKPDRDDHPYGDLADTVFAERPMRLCVAICTRNRPEQLADCLDSIAASNLVDEVVVSSDGSDDETEMVALSAADKFRSFTLLRGPRRGLAANRNNCISAIHSEYVLFLDDDARLSASYVEVALAAARADRLVTGWELRNGVKVTPHDPDFLGFQRVAPAGTPKAIVINATLFPTAFLRARSFDAFYKFGSEELDIAFGAANQGLAIVEIDEGNEHLHVPISRKGNDRAAVASRIYFGVRRYRDYERNWSNLTLFLVLSLINILGFQVKRRQFTSLPTVSCDFGRAVCAAWFMTDERLRHTSPSPTLSPAETNRPPVQRRSQSLTVLIPTYRRPTELEQCLQAVLRQSQQPTEIIVVRQESDEDAARVINSFKHAVYEVTVGEGGQVAALRAGLSRASGDFVAVTDDDTVPRRDWLERLEAGFDDDSVGAVGGRDVVHHGAEIEEGWEPIVGRFTWYGKPIGNHHLGIGEARDVDFLKGCNYAVRRVEFKIPVGLLGSGAQLSNDLASCLELRRAGYRTVYDPRIVVDHYPGERHDEDHRSHPSRRARMNGTFNEAYSVFSLARKVRIRYLIFHVVVGDTGSPGLVRTLLGYIRQEDAVTGRLLNTWAALIRAYRLSTVSPLPMWHPNRDSNPPLVSSQAGRLREVSDKEWSA
jgi:glycosyltransferase involved in cell wall biosynthesis